MNVEFERVMDGILQYLNNELYPRMTQWQDFLARVLVGRFAGNVTATKNMLMNNGFIKTFGLINADGTVDIEALAKDVKRELAKKDKISFDIPIFGKITFRAADVDVLFKTITNKELS